MTNYDSGMSGGASMRLVVTQGSQSIANNTTTLNWEIWLFCSNGLSWQANPQPWNSSIGGNAASGTYTFDFRSSTSKKVASGSRTITHNADGTASVSVSASLQTGVSLGNGSVSGTFYPTTIPRASTPSFSTFTAGSSGSISTNRASTSFTHTLTYTFGSYSGTIATGVGASTSWTPPLSLLNAIPNATSGTGTITCRTFSGNTLVGEKSVGFTLTAPSSITPSIGSISDSEAVAAVASSMGMYVQHSSRLNLAINGAAGAYSSTIKSHRITAAGFTINAASGTTGVVAVSGSVTVTATVTDSRGRTATETKTVSVAAYTPPAIASPGVSVRRVLADGTLSDEGTSLRVNFTGSVRSLVNGTQRNTMRYRISTRPYGDTVWTLIKNELLPAGEISKVVSERISTYGIDSSWEVLVEVIDVFATSTIISTVPTAKVFMHWNQSAGLGIGKYHENGALDVAGTIFHKNGQEVASLADLPPNATSSTRGTVLLATNAQAQAGTDASRAVTPAALASLTATDTRKGLLSVATAAEVAARTDTQQAITPGRMASHPGVPWAMAAGSMGNVNVAAGGTNKSTVTFPSGRFNSAPRLALSMTSDYRDISVFADGNPTSTGFVLCRGSTSAGQRNDVTAQWIAIQMTSGNGSG